MMVIFLLRPTWLGGLVTSIPTASVAADSSIARLLLSMPIISVARQQLKCRSDALLRD